VTTAKASFEDRLLPILIEELQQRDALAIQPSRSRTRMRNKVAILTAAVVLTATALVLTSGGNGDAPLNVVVTSAAMFPTLEAGQQVAVDANAYRSAQPILGDIIAFRSAGFPDLVSIKRVVGLPGDTVEEVSGVVFVNGQRLDEPYVRTDEHTGGPWTVLPGHVFVMGDNRPNSNDSRFSMGQIPVGDIIGRVMPDEVPEDRPQAPLPAPATTPPH
jgi:signal peptidase I